MHPRQGSFLCLRYSLIQLQLVPARYFEHPNIWWVFTKSALNLNSHWVFHIAGSIFSSPHPVCLRTCWGCWVPWVSNVWRLKSTLAKPQICCQNFPSHTWIWKIEECSPKTKKTLYSSGWFKQDNLFVTVLPKFSVSPHEILGVSAFQPFFVPPQICAGPPGRSTDQRHRMSLILHPLSKVKGLQPRQPTQVPWWRETKGGDLFIGNGGNSA